MILDSWSVWRTVLLHWSCYDGVLPQAGLMQVVEMIDPQDGLKFCEVPVVECMLLGKASVKSWLSLYWLFYV